VAVRWQQQVFIQHCWQDRQCGKIATNFHVIDSGGRLRVRMGTRIRIRAATRHHSAQLDADLVVAVADEPRSAVGEQAILVASLIARTRCGHVKMAAQVSMTQDLILRSGPNLQTGVPS